MDDSAFDYYYVGDAVNGSVPTYRFCSSSGNEPTSFTLAPSCDPDDAFEMTCSYAGAVARAPDTPFPPETDSSMTLIQAFGFDSISRFREHCIDLAPDGYVDRNGSYFGCLYSASAILIAIFGIMMAGEGGAEASQPAEKITAARQAAARVLEIIARIPTIDTFGESGKKPSGGCSGEIELRDVVFAYPTAPDQRVCDGYSLTIRAGQTVALCGASGSGKSTIISLIERFYDPQGGVVLLDGVDIKELNVRWLRQQLGLVGQEPVLFMGTVAENIGFGKAGATREEIEAAAAAANAHGFITESLAHGYDTQVGQGGSKLSGGQKQRVAIARALVRAPAVLLLDEATSALDNESERVVQAALDEIMAKQKRTTVVIAHRLSTIRGADKIAVVSRGRVVEEGTHDELLQIIDGHYQNLVKASRSSTISAA